MSNRELGKPALDFLAPQSTVKAINRILESHVDPIGIFTPLVHAQVAWLAHPMELSDAVASFSKRMLALQWHSCLKALGVNSEDVEKPHPDDNRFSEPIWTESATWDIAKEWYLSYTHHIQDMLYNTPGLSHKDRRRAAFWWRKWLNAVAPTNFLLTNPVAIRKAVESRGDSLVRGFRNFLEDVRHGNLRMTNPDDFKVGESLASTAGDVVFRNRLVEVIRYKPKRAKTYARPLVIVMPWINKFYLLDLTPKKSMVLFLLEQGFDVYITSWKNPDASMSEVTFEDYIIQGVASAIDVAKNISGSAQVNAVGYCIGGAALATYMAWANKQYAKKDMPVASFTLFTTLVDYKNPGDIEVFLDEGTVHWLTKTMEEKGYLDGKQMAMAFRLLRSNSLIWHYVVHGYLYGEPLQPLDVLFWNMDATRMPAKMHAWYLREFYLENNLVKKNGFSIAGQGVDLGAIDQPLYAVAAADDHIAPWQQTFKVNHSVSGSRRFVLSSSGHILGIVNPVVSPPKREYWVETAERHDSAEAWREKAAHMQGSWWEDWMAWLKPKSGKLVSASTQAHPDYPPLCPAPGIYVLES